MIDTAMSKRRAGLEPYQKELADLRKKGREYRATCPWHNDRNPSLSVYKKEGEWFYKCFGCDKSGDVIKFIQEKRGIDFREAIQMIQSEYGAELLPEERTTTARRQGFHSVVPQFDRAAATAALKENKKAQEYLAGRGISLDTAISNGLGVFKCEGLGLCVAIPYATGEAKFRVLPPAEKGFRSMGKINSKLYGLEKLDADWAREAENLLVVESELDSITAQEALGPD